jgi:heterodisulfide reductase subunit A
VLEEINLDPSFLEFVNIREHCSYVHKEDHDVALEVAKDLVKSGVYRSQKNEFVPKLEVPITQSVLVIGAGVGGIRAALDIADQGIKVYLVEKEPTIGGKMSMLDRTFPTDDCSI